LLLDEATSALDTKSEGVVQAALEVAAAGRTTITIAHRLSTIKDADNIVVMTEGRIVEQGNHNELLAAKGAYYGLVEAQKIAATRELTPEEQEAADKQDDELIREKSRQSGYEEDPDDKNIASKLKRTQSEKSQSSVALAKRQKGGEQRDSLWTLIKLIASFNTTEWPWMIVGLFFSIICGGGNPTQAVFFAKEIISLSLPLTSVTTGQPIPGNAGTIRHDVNFWSLMYLMLAIVQFIAFCAQGVAFAFCSERLVHRVRDRAFRTILRQDIEFFDKEENTAGALTSFLSTETTHVAGLSGVTLGTLLTVITTLIAAITLSVAIAWKLALVCTATIPILLACGFLRFWLLARFQQRAKKAYEKSASYACEATSAIRTVASLTREQDVLDHYIEALNIQAGKSLKSVLNSSLLYAASQSLMFLCVALGFW
jgi:ATP-binding cassette subfamily B (MDR/TAP) protein 1